MDRLDISAGLMTKYHQNHAGDSGYMAGLRLLAYDMLYGERYIYGGTNPFKATDLKMGRKGYKNRRGCPDRRKILYKGTELYGIQQDFP